MAAVPSPLLATLPTLLVFVLFLLALAWLSRQLSLQIQWLLYVLTRSEDLTMLLLFLLLLPGVIIHEAAHWGMARLLGLKAGKFRVWPKKKGKHIGLGSVSVQRGQLWQDSLVGMAPLIVGSMVVAMIGESVFNARDLSLALGDQRWLDGWHAFQQALQKPDGFLWAYLLFAIGNAMMPSASDREPIKPLLYYTGLAIGVYSLLGLPATPFTQLLNWLAPALQNLTNALIFIVILDSLILLALFLILRLIMPVEVR